MQKAITNWAIMRRRAPAGLSICSNPHIFVNLVQELYGTEMPSLGKLFDLFKPCTDFHKLRTTTKPDCRFSLVDISDLQVLQYDYRVYVIVYLVI